MIQSILFYVAHLVGYDVPWPHAAVCMHVYMHNMPQDGWSSRLYDVFRFVIYVSSQMISRFSNPFPLLLKGEMNFTHVFLDSGDMYLMFVDAFNLK